MLKTVLDDDIRTFSSVHMTIQVGFFQKVMTEKCLMDTKNSIIFARCRFRNLQQMGAGTLSTGKDASNYLSTRKIIGYFLLFSSLFQQV